MKMGIILNTNESETVWNVFRLANEALKKEHNVTIFFLGKGVECEQIRDKQFDVQKVIAQYKENNGSLLACGTCLQSRGKDESVVCPISSMAELLQLVTDCDRVLSF